MGALAEFKRGKMIQSLDRGIAILFLLKQKGSATATELAEALNIHKSSASRLIDTLRQYDLIQQDPDSKKFRLGYRLLFLGENIQRNTHAVIETSRPFLFKLSSVLKESVHLGNFYNKKVYVVDQIRSNKEYQMPAALGMIEPAHASSLGKSIFAYRAPEFITKYMNDYGMRAFTEHTITDIDSLLAHLSKIRRQGYALDDQELKIGVRCIAAPIFNRHGEVNFSVGISGPAVDFNADRIAQFSRLIKKTCMEISQALGYRGN
jgi:DNA-binding IclR family transcriptional regulator